MQVKNDIHSQQLALGRAFSKGYDRIFQSYVKKLENYEEKDTESRQEAFDKFYDTQKKLRDRYEAAKYKLDIQDRPNIYTMTSVTNYNQKITLDKINEEIEIERKKLKEKLASGKYDFMERLRLNNEFNDFRENLREKAFGDIKKFNDQYQRAFIKKDFSTISNLQNSLLSSLLSGDL